MLKFRTKEGRAASRPPNYLGHKYQRPWIIGLFILAGAIWLLRGGDPGRLSNVFSSEKEVKDPAVDGERSDNVVAPRPLGVVQGNKADNPVEGKQLFHGVKPSLFANLEDDEVNRNAERAAFYEVLGTLDDAKERDLQLASKGVVVYRQLVEQTDVYRGEIVTVGGTVAQIVPQKAALNTNGVQNYYDVWIEPHGGKNPIVISVLEIPEGFPLEGGGIGQPISATGFFYKRLGYQGRPDPKTGAEKFRSAPLVLAKTLAWTPKAGTKAQFDQAGGMAAGGIPGLPDSWVMPLLGIGIVVMIFLAVWSFRLSRSSVLDRNGPIVGRARRAAEDARKSANLNQFKIEP